MTEGPKKRAGRPPKAAAVKADTFSVRLLPEMRAKLEEAAARAGRSLAAEIAARLDASFTGELTYVLLDRRLRELEELNNQLASQSFAAECFAYDLKALGDSTGPEVEEQRKSLRKMVDLYTWEQETTKKQLARVESEANALIDDLGRKVSMTAEKVLQQLPPR